MQLIINEKVAGAEKHATEAEKQMWKTEKNSYHGNWETNKQMQKAEKTAIMGAGKQMQKAEKTATMGAGKQMWRALNYYKKRE